MFKFCPTLQQAFACLLLILSASLSIAAQTDEETPTHEFTVWGGISPDSSTVFKGTGRTKDARFGVVAARYARRFNNNDTVNLKYTFDAIPVAVLNYPDTDLPVAGAVIPAGFGERRTAYGFGISPLGLQVNFRPRKKVQPFVEATGGLLYLDKRVPRFTGTRFQFTANVGAGIEFMLANKRSVTVGYKYFHISNGDRGATNPGFDNNLFYVGYTFAR